MNRFHMDGLERIDANLNAFFGRQLEQIRTQVFEKRYPELKGRTMVPTKNDINVGAEAYTYQSIDEAGEAGPMADYTDDAPMVESKGGSEDSHKMRGIQLAYGWHMQEGRNAVFAGQNLSNRKALACRRGIERAIDKSLLLGSTMFSGLTMQGLFTLSGGQAPVSYTVQNTTWADEDPDAIYADLVGIGSKIVTDSNEIEVPDTLVLPPTRYEMLLNRRMGDSNNLSILKYFMTSQDRIKTILTSHYLEASGGHSGGSVARMVCYQRDPEKLEGLVNEFEQHPPEFKGLRVVTTCTARIGGVATYFPKSIAYGDNI